MGNVIKFPITHAELIQLGDGEIVRFPATFSEYWELLEEAHYKADYSENQIVAMSYESNAHSKIDMAILMALARIFGHDALFTVHNSNRPVFCGASGAIHNPDASVVREPARLFEYKPGMNAETTPVVLVEILSKTTRAYDFAEKLPHYKLISGLRQIIYIESARPFVTVFERTNDDLPWQNTDFNHLADQFLINGQPVSLSELYQKVVF